MQGACFSQNDSTKVVSSFNQYDVSYILLLFLKSFVQAENVKAPLYNSFMASLAQKGAFNSGQLTVLRSRF